MAVMPEASSALFMSQFSDEAVRDAISRVSHSFSIQFTLQLSSSSECAMLCDIVSLRGTPSNWGIYTSRRYVYSGDVVCLGWMRRAFTENINNLWLSHFIFHHPTSGAARKARESLKSHPCRRFMTWISFAPLRYSYRVIVTCHLISRSHNFAHYNIEHCRML